MRKINFCIFFLLCVITPIKRTTVCAEEGKVEFPEEYCWDLRAKVEYLKLPKIDKLLQILKIRPGMTVLEIGTGTGQRACIIAEKLRGTGKVYVTDTRSDCIDFVQKQVREKGLDNLYPVLVSEKGVDKFYSKHRYDLIFLYQVYFKIKDRAKYIKEMANFLTEDGHLVLIGFNSKRFHFSLEDVTDFKGLIEELSGEPSDSPFYQGLRKSTRKLIKQESGNNPSELLRKSIIEDFNSERMLFNPYFLDNFLTGDHLKKGISFSPEEMDYVTWGLQIIKAMRCFDSIKKYSYADKNKAETKAMKKPFFRQHQILNGLFILQRFRRYFHSGNKSRFLSGGKAERYLTVKDELEDAGYKLDREYDLVPFLFILDFTVNQEARSCLFP